LGSQKYKFAGNLEENVNRSIGYMRNGGKKIVMFCLEFHALYSSERF